ncbi:MAG: hypothetical protein AAGI01_05940, partial [Myxococcota bacterium]
MRRPILLATYTILLVFTSGCDLFFLEAPQFLPPPCGTDERVQVDGRQYRCVPCAPGSTNAPGDERLEGTSACDPTLCGENERVNDHVCEPCAEGTSRPPGDDASGADTICAPILCDFNERVASKRCVACPTGTFNRAGDDSSSGGDTECDDSAMCDVDEFVSDRSCEPCPPGTLNEPGDEQFGGDTECDVLACGADEFVRDNECVTCAPGTTSAAGAQTSGENTTCAPILCSEDFFVRQNECVPCPNGASNDAGDNASMGDTMCKDACLMSIGLLCDDFDNGYLKASNTDPRDRFGSSVAIDGDLLAVGAPLEGSIGAGVNGDQNDNSAFGAGAVFVFERDTEDEWKQIAYIKSPEPLRGARFGQAIALEARRLVVGAPDFDGGRVYIFEQNDSGVWTYKANIMASQGSGGKFGTAVDLDGDTLAVGAPEDANTEGGINGPRNNSLQGVGAAYVFQRGLNDEWREDAYIKASVPDQNDFFGYALSIDGGTLVVGAYGEDGAQAGPGADQGSNLNEDGGAVYVFNQDDRGWFQSKYIKAPNTGRFDFFGFAVDLV